MQVAKMFVAPHRRSNPQAQEAKEQISKLKNWGGSLRATLQEMERLSLDRGTGKRLIRTRESARVS
jgi:hypothetical protein